MPRKPRRTTRRPKVRKQYAAPLAMDFFAAQLHDFVVEWEKPVSRREALRRLSEARAEAEAMVKTMDTLIDRIS
jgi:hypothetical protein